MPSAEGCVFKAVCLSHAADAVTSDGELGASLEVWCLLLLHMSTVQQQCWCVQVLTDLPPLWRQLLPQGSMIRVRGTGVVLLGGV